MSGSRICCCGGFTGCAICSTPDDFLGLPSPVEWCQIEYEFLIPSISLQEVKSSSRQTNYEISISSEAVESSPCDCQDGSSDSADVIAYDINENIACQRRRPVVDGTPVGGGFGPDGPSYYGCTYDSRSLFAYELDENTARQHIFIYGDILNYCCPNDPATSGYYNFQSIDVLIFPRWNVTQFESIENISCSFKSCSSVGFGPPVEYLNADHDPALISSGSPDPPINIDFDIKYDDTAPSAPIAYVESGTVKVLPPNTGSFVPLKVRYVPVIRTIKDVIPVPTERCYYELQDEDIPGSINKPTDTFRSCFAPEPDERCRCRSLLKLEIDSVAYIRTYTLLWNPLTYQYIEQNGSATTITLPIPGEFVGLTFGCCGPYEEGTAWCGDCGTPGELNGRFWPGHKMILYYFGCIDDAIYGDSTAPTSRIFTLDSGIFKPGGFDAVTYCGSLSLIDVELESYEPTCTYRPCVCSGSSNQLSSCPIDGSWFVNNFGIPPTITVTRKT